MVCPTCQTEMTAGEFKLKSPMDLLNTSTASLRFTPATKVSGKPDRVAVFWPGDARDGWLCERCGMTVVQGPPLPDLTSASS
jgi:hypothetical protein